MAHDWKDEDMVVEVRVCDPEGQLLAVDVYGPDGAVVASTTWGMGEEGLFRYSIGNLLRYLADEIEWEPRLEVVREEHASEKKMQNQSSTSKRQ